MSAEYRKWLKNVVLKKEFPNHYFSVTAKRRGSRPELTEREKEAYQEICEEAAIEWTQGHCRCPEEMGCICGQRVNF